MLDLLVLIAARRNSKYLAKFLFGLEEHTNRPKDMEVRVIMNEHDTWNRELQLFADRGGFASRVLCYRENLRLGRAGLHEYFNMLLDPDEQYPPAWVIYFCEDHFINYPGWDTALREYISGERRSGDSDGKEFPLDPDDIWVLVPKFDNCGAMNHVVSRGFIKAMGGKIGNHGWIDSYINDLMRDFPDRVIRVDEEWFHDFTHDKPSPMDDAHLQTVISEKGKALPKYEDPVVRHRIKVDQEKLKRALAKEGR